MSSWRWRREGGPDLARLLDTHGAVRWDIGPLLATGGRERRLLELVAPSADLGATWDVTVQRREYTWPVRLELSAHWGDIEPYRWIVDQLVSRNTRATAYIPATLAAGPVEWQWPLRLGLLNNPSSLALRNRLQPTVMWQELLDWVTVDGPDTPSDLLILPSSPGSPLDPLISFPDDLNVGSILLLGAGVSRGRATIIDVRRFLRSNRVNAWGIAFVDVRPKSAGGFLHEVMRELSHDQTLDVALCMAGWGSTRVKPPILLANPQVLARSHITSYAERLVGLLPEANGGDIVHVSRAVAGRLPLRPGLTSRRVLRGALMARPNFAYESTGASAVTTLVREARDRSVELAPTPRPRRIQTDVFAQGSVRTTKARFTEHVEGSLRPDMDYQIDVSVRFARSGAVQASIDLDPLLLPQDRGTHVLHVTFQQLGTDAPAQLGRLRLPYDGESEPARFSFRTGPTGYFRARIMLSFRNRILQMVRFEARVEAEGGGEGRPPRRRRPQRLLVESSPRASMSDLGHRRTFDFAVVANHDERGLGQVGVLKKGKYTRFGTTRIDDTLNWFEQTLSQLAGVADTLMSPRFEKLLRELARAGSEIFDFLVAFQVKKDILQPTHGRIQIVAGDPSAFFPIEFVYDMTRPDAEARLCKNARAALEQGICPKDCPPKSQESSVICPLGFWCLSRVIERHAFMQGNALNPQEYALLAEPPTGRASLRPLGGAVFGAAKKVDGIKAGSIALVTKALGNVLRSAIEPVKDWNDWRAAVARQSPPLLVILCHTEVKGRKGRPTIRFQIGASEKAGWLEAGEVKGPYVLGPKGVPHPVVFLIGCSTAVEKVKFQSAVMNFTTYGAAIVLSTLATVTGEQASTVTASLLEELDKLSQERQKTFGDALLEIRRSLLAKDITMVLALVAFGDADWRLARAGRGH